ncbi:MAG: hypothetical protein N2169_03255 [bacterium]|nr:hypothetical protein [bacterium]
MPKVEIIEKPKHYKLTEIHINDKVFFFDAVKKIIRFDFDLFWITVIGGIELKPFPKYTNTFSFYIYNYYETLKADIFSKLRNLGLEFSGSFQNYDSLMNYIMDLSNFNRDYVFAIFSKISDFDSYEFRDFVEKYTNNYMLNLESLSVYGFCKNICDERFIVVSDGSLSKFHRFSIPSNMILVGLVKEIERNYLSEFGNYYLHGLPFGSRSSAFYLIYNGFRVLSFYLNIGKLIRLEIWQDDLDELIKIGSFVLSLSNLPALYYRMPQNNIVLTKLERKLKNYILNEVLFNKLV